MYICMIHTFLMHHIIYNNHIYIYSSNNDNYYFLYYIHIIPYNHHAPGPAFSGAECMTAGLVSAMLGAKVMFARSPASVIVTLWLFNIAMV